MAKRGQVSIFIILGLLVLLFIGFFVFYAQSQQKEALEKAEEMPSAPLQAYIEQCIHDVGNNAITFVSLQGGYYSTPAPAYSFGLYEIPYYYSDDTSTVPSLENMETELGIYVDEKLSFCIQNFSSFTEQGYTITAEEPKTTASIEEDSVSFIVKYPIHAAHKQTTESYSSFFVEIPSDIFFAHDIAEQIIAAHTDATKMPLSKMTDLAEEYRIFLNLGNFNDTVIYTLNIPTEDIDKPFIFQFAVRYHWGDPLE